MLIVGLNLAHDAGVCIVDGGRVLGLYQRERFTRVKRQAFVPAEFLRFCLGRAGVSWADVDGVAVTSSQSWPLLLLQPDAFGLRHDPTALETFALKGMTPRTAGALAQAFARRQAFADRRHRAFLEASHSYQEYVGDDLADDDGRSAAIPSIDWAVAPHRWQDAGTTATIRTFCRSIPQTLDRHYGYAPLVATLDGIKKPGLLVTHHLSHAAAAFYPSGRETAAIYTLDNGDGADKAQGYKGGIVAYGSGRRIAPIAPTYDYHGHFYQRVGERLKLGHGGAAGKLMGLAPYGRARFFSDEMVGTGAEVFGHAFSRGTKRDLFHVLEKLETVFLHRRGAAYRGTAAVSPHHVAGAFGAENVTLPGIDLAMTAQRVFEENSLRSLRALRDGLLDAGLETRDLLLSGGGALNCPANSRIWGEGLFENVFVPPYCDDSGLALGAALALAHDILDLPRQPMPADRGEGAYLGLAYDAAATDAALAARRDAVTETPADGSPAEAAARDVAAGRIVAWFEGRSEVGPRALGHRSILADPRDAAKWREVNRVKKREYWRPFAPAVLAEKASHWFAGAPTPSPFMLFNAQVRSRGLPAITHVDGSARIQTVDPSCGGFRKVLEAFDALTGVPVVMNTSFNGPGEPIVETPDEALAFLATSEIDAIYIDGRRFTRHGGLTGPR